MWIDVKILDLLLPCPCVTENWEESIKKSGFCPLVYAVSSRSAAAEGSKTASSDSCLFSLVCPPQTYCISAMALLTHGTENANLRMQREGLFFCPKRSSKC